MILPSTVWKSRLGETHQRQRKIMNPAFFAPQLRTHLSLFQSSADKVKGLYISIASTGLTLPNDTIARSKVEGGSNRRGCFWTTTHQCDGMAFTHYARYHWRRSVRPCDALVLPVLIVVIVVLILLPAGFGFQFGSLDNVKTPLREQYENIL